MVRILVILLLTCVAANGAPRYTDRMYRHALVDLSTSPQYVLITLHNLKIGSERVVCIEAPFLLGAIETEYHLGNDDAGIRQQLRMAIAQPHKVFAFSKRSARQNVAPRYIPKVLSEVRHLLAPLSDSDLAAQVRASDSELHQIYHSRGSAEYAAYRDAIAHVLLEHGIQVCDADLTGSLVPP